MKKLTKIALLLVTASTLLLASCGQEKEETSSASQLSEASKNLSNVANDQYADKVKIAIDNTKALKEANLDPSKVKLAPSDRQFIRYTQSTMPYTIDPSKISSASDSFAVSEIFDTLVRLHRSGEIIGQAAESWDTSEDGLTWTFHLRKDATWSDGKPVLAKDFLYSWHRLADPKTASLYSFYLAELKLKNVADVLSGKKPVEELGIEAPDDYTFVLHLDSPLPWLLQTLSLVNLSPLRQDVIEKWGTEWTKPEHMVVNGPFKIVEYKLNDRMIYKKREDYWDAKNVVVNTIQLDFISNAKAGYFNYLQNITPTAAIPKDLKESVLNERPEELIYIYRPTIYYLKSNQKTVTDARVRKAVSLLLNRQFLVNKILGSGEATTKMAPNTVSEGELIKEQPYLNRDYAENAKDAQKLLKEAGYSKEKPFVMNYLGGASDFSKKLAVAFKAFFEDGSDGLISFVPEFVDAKTSYDKIQNGQFDFTFSGWSADYNQASNFFNLYRCGSSQNDISYCNPKFDATLDKAVAETDPHKRAELYAQANEIMVGEDAALMAFEQVREFLLKSPALGGYSPWLMNRYMRDWFFIDGKEVKNSK